MSGSRDDVPVRRGAVRPPPSPAPDDSPDSIDVPRMEPPPASLEAMVHSVQRAQSSDASPPWWLWVVLIAVAGAVIAYVMR